MVWWWLQLGTSDNLESKFRALEGGDVEDELAQLKKGTLTGARSGPQALPEGRPIRWEGDFPGVALLGTIRWFCHAVVHHYWEGLPR